MFSFFKTSLLFMLFTMLLPQINHAQQIALTFDDAPMRDGYFSGAERTEKLIAALEKVGVEQVAFFVVTSRMDEVGAARVRRYSEAGHVIANHSHRHQSMRRIGVPLYIDGIFAADSILRSLPGFRPWYRYPFLDEGRTRASRDAIRSALEKRGYFNGYVTVDNYDFMLDALFVEAHRARRRIDFDALKIVYIEHLWNSVKFYGQMSRQVLGRSAKHVLLLHENDLAALFIGDFVAFLRTQGWQVISPVEAYSDPIAGMIPDVLLNNQGRIAAIARARGYDGDFSQQSENRAYLEKRMNEAVFDQR